MICLYHRDDLDGICSAAIVNKYLQDTNQQGTFIGMSYSDLKEFDISKLDSKEKVVVVDFCLKEKDMRSLAREERLIWIDHHISYIKLLKDILDNIPGYRSTDNAACWLTWQYFFNSYPPISVNYLSAYDVWNHQDPRVLPFQYGMRLRNLKYDSRLWTILLNKEDPDFPQLMNDLSEAGKIILEYKTSQNKHYCEAAAFETTLKADKEYMVLACNRLFSGSDLFDSKWDPEKYDLMIGFGWRKNIWQVSFRSTDKEVDCSKIAEYFGGGGHVGSAGCMVSYITIDKNEIILEV